MLRVDPLLLGIAMFFALLTLAPKRPDFGVGIKDHIAILSGAFLAAAFAALAFS